MRLSLSYKQILVSVGLLFLAAIGFALTAAALSNSGRSQQNDGLVIDNKTRSFQVEGAQRNERSLGLTIRNRYDKGIKAYTVGVGDLKMEEDFVYSDRVIAPGEVYTVDIPLPRSVLSKQQLKISVLAVVFEDSSSDGVTKTTSAITDRRLGEKLQFNRTIQLLQSVMDSNDDDASKLDKLKDQAASLSEDGTLSPGFRSGLHNGKEELKQIIQQLEQKRQSGEFINLREKSIETKQQYDKKISKLSGN